MYNSIAFLPRYSPTFQLILHLYLLTLHLTHHTTPLFTEIHASLTSHLLLQPLLGYFQRCRRDEAIQGIQGMLAQGRGDFEKFTIASPRLVKNRSLIEWKQLGWIVGRTSWITWVFQFLFGDADFETFRKSFTDGKEIESA